MKHVSLKDVCEINMGQAPPGESYNDVGNGLPLVAGAGDFGELYPFPKKHTTAPSKESSPGDIILCIRATIGDVNWADKEYCLGRGVAGLRPKPDKLDKDYLWFWLPTSKNALARDARGSTFKQVTRSAVESLNIPLPPLSEQRRIASILNKADDIRQKRQESIKLTETLLRSTFLDMFGDPSKNPNNWDTGKIRDLCEIIVDCPHSTPKYTATATEYACVRSSDIQNGFLDWSSTKYVDEDEYTERVKRLIPSPGDVIYCREGARFGNAARVTTDKKICLGQRMMLLRASEKVATSEFIWAILSSDSIYHQAAQSSGGSASPHVNVKDIKAFKTIVPPLSLQQKYSKTVKNLEGVKTKQNTLEEESNILFDSLVQRAFKGEL